MKIMFVGGGGFTDAGGWYIGPDGKIHRIPGWADAQIGELVSSLTVLRAASQIKTPGVAQAAISAVLGVAQKELGQHALGGAVVVVLA